MVVQPTHSRILARRGRDANAGPEAHLIAILLCDEALSIELDFVAPSRPEGALETRAAWERWMKPAGPRGSCRDDLCSSDRTGLLPSSNSSCAPAVPTKDGWIAIAPYVDTRWIKFLR